MLKDNNAEYIKLSGLNKGVLGDIKQINQKMTYHQSCPPEHRLPVQPFPAPPVVTDDDAQSVAPSMTAISDDESISGASTMSSINQAITNVQKSGFGTHPAPIDLTQDEEMR